MKKSLITLFFVLFVFIPFSLYAKDYSLEELFKIALERNETIKIAEEDLYISEQGKDKARAALLPRLYAFGYHTKYSEEKRQNTFLLQPEYTNEWGLRLDQSLSLSGREITGYKIARQTIKKSRSELNSVKEGYLLDVASQYYILLRTKKGMEISRVNVERLTKHRDAAKIRLKVGEVTKTVLLRAEAELAGAQSELIKSENNQKIAKTRLAKAVGISGDYDVKEPLPRIDFKMPENVFSALYIFINDCQLPMPDCLKEIALTGRAEINAFVIQKKIAEDEIRYAKGSYWPTLSVEGVYFRQENEPSSSFGLNERIYGGLKLDFPFF